MVIIVIFILCNKYDIHAYLNGKTQVSFDKIK